MGNKLLRNLLTYDWIITNSLGRVWLVIACSLLPLSFAKMNSAIFLFVKSNFFLSILICTAPFLLISYFYEKAKNDFVHAKILTQPSPKFSWVVLVVFLALIGILFFLSTRSEFFDPFFYIGILSLVGVVNEVKNAFRKEDVLLCLSKDFVRIPSNRNRAIKREKIIGITHKQRSKKLIVETERFEYEIKDVNIAPEDVVRLREIILIDKQVV